MVILSLIIAQVILPLVTPDSPEVKIGNMSFKRGENLHFRTCYRLPKSKSTFETSYRYGNVIKDYHDKLTFLKTVEKEDENSKELERLQKIAFNVETKTLEKLVDDGRNY